MRTESYPRLRPALSLALLAPLALPRPLWESLLVAPNGGFSRGSRALR